MEVGYAKRTWDAFCEGKKGKIIFLLVLLQLVPIFGQIVLLGVAYRWAREAAWGIEKPLANEFGNWSKLLRFGCIVFITEFAIALIAGIALAIIEMIPVVGTLALILSWFITIAIALFAGIASLRGVIYNDYGAPYQFTTIFEMIKRDFNGIARVFGFWLLLSVIALTILSIVLTAIFVATFSSIVAVYGSAIAFAWSAADVSALSTTLDQILASAEFMSALGSFIVLFGLVMFLYGFVQVTITMLQARAVGYWVANFKPAIWGASRDPLPSAEACEREVQYEAKGETQEEVSSEPKGE